MSKQKKPSSHQPNLSGRATTAPAGAGSSWPQMPLVLPADLPPALAPLAWMIGTWEGVGVGQVPPQNQPQMNQPQEYQFGQRLSFTVDSLAAGPAQSAEDFATPSPLLTYTCQVWLLDQQGHPTTLVDQESGFWLPGQLSEPGQPTPVNVVLSNAGGYVEVYVGSAHGPRVEILSEVVGRTKQAASYTAGQRLYGLVDGDLLYAHDAAFDDPQTAPPSPDSPGTPSAPLRPLRSARLKRTSHSGDASAPLGDLGLGDLGQQPTSEGEN